MLNIQYDVFGEPVKEEGAIDVMKIRNAVDQFTLDASELCATNHALAEGFITVYSLLSYIFPTLNIIIIVRRLSDLSRCTQIITIKHICYFIFYFSCLIYIV